MAPMRLLMPAVLILGGLAAVAGGQTLSLLAQIGAGIILCLSYWLLMGQGGMVSFGHAAYSGLGAFAAVHLMRAIEQGLHWPVALVPLAAGLAAAAVALPLGWLATRHHSSMAFAMITLGLGELVWVMAQMFPFWFGGEAGLGANRSAGAWPWGPSWGPTWQVYLLTLAYTLAVVALVRAMLGSPFGRLLNAVRDQPVRVSCLGHDPRRIRQVCFVVAAALAGLAGGLLAVLNEFVSTDALASHRSASVLMFTVIGGLSHLSGALVAGVLMVLGTVVLSSWTSAWLLYLGLFFLLVLRLAPQGLGPALPRLWPLVRRAPLRALALCVALVGAGAAVEMAYQWRLISTLGPVASYLGLALDAQSPWHWLSALSATALGWAGWSRGRGRA
jgi:branched-chain amino acid transport system permease protein